MSHFHQPIRRLFALLLCLTTLLSLTSMDLTVDGRHSTKESVIGVPEP